MTTPSSVSTQPTPGNVSLERKADDLWNQAVLSMKDGDRSLIDFQRSNKLSVLGDVLESAERKRAECLAKRWKVKGKDGEVIILRDVFEKIIKWVNNFKVIGDLAVQVDPGHASLPWAGIRLLLQWTINDSQTFGAMVEGLETITNLIARYSIFEALYLRTDSHTTKRLRQSIIMVYAAILNFLGKAIHYYNQNTVSRFAKSLVKFTDATLTELMQEVRHWQVEVERDAVLVVTELQQTTSIAISGVSQSTDMISSMISGMMSHFTAFESDHFKQLQHLQSVLSRIEEPIFRISNQVSDFQDGLEKNERLRVLDWLSLIPYPWHHENARTDRLEFSGSWMLQKPRFRYWAHSSSSAILWLHVIPGSGKTKLASVVIDECLQKISGGSPRGFAYFHCARDPTEPLRADPVEVLRSIARQLSCTNLNLPVHPNSVELYKKERDERFAMKKLNATETVSLILKVTHESPATIVIDALDECNPSRRHELFEALTEILRKSSNVVKIFVTSRDDGDIVCHLNGSPNIYIDVHDNSEDIARFIDAEIQRAISQKKLLHGEVSSNLRDLLVETLKNGSQGMFRWVSLQLQNLCNPHRMKVESDVRAELGKLPKTLSDLYAVIYDQIQQSGVHSSRIGERALKWMLATNDILRTYDLAAILSYYDDPLATNLSFQNILDMTCNLLVQDPLKPVFRFAHISVREYLETLFDNDDVHMEPARKCLEFYLSDRIDPGVSGRPDAMMNWPHHCSRISTNGRTRVLSPLLSSFLFQGNDPSPSFKIWRNEADGANLLLALRDPFLAVCYLGFAEIVTALSSAEVSLLNDRLWNLKYGPDHNDTTYSVMNGLHVAVMRNKTKTVKILLEKGVNVGRTTLKGKTPLHLAAEQGNAKDNPNADQPRCRSQLNNN